MVNEGWNMEGHAAGRDDRTLWRIISMLVALAALAEQAAARSFPVRFLVLCILRHAEAVAWAFVAGTPGLPLPAIDEIPAIGNDPADAILLAARLRALAAALAALLCPDWPCRNVRIGGAFRRAAPGVRLAAPDGLEPKPHDTS